MDTQTQYILTQTLVLFFIRYELHAIQLAKLKRIAMTSEKTSDTSAYEVEMAERNQAASIAPSTP